ncbi:MAG TPA: class I SAM-dependent methyltransferase [Candidatus Binataceae bacterium]|nr:class I SAM-dependent methyltransferase [Candidatus Binataceae bacterium]
MTQPQTWDPDRYAKNARFVADLGQPVVELLAPRAAERILDLGCGDGALTQKLAAMGCDVVGVDASPLQIEAARRLGLDAWVMSADALNYDNEFDAVFSNAVLHWVRRADDAIACVYRALKSGGRFVGEMGGVGCVEKIRTTLIAALDRRGIDGRAADPWYFPTVADYSACLERGGFRVNYIELIQRPTPLPGDVSGWLETFAESFIIKLPAADRPAFIDEVRGELAPKLKDSSGTWIADYVRLRFAAAKPAA